MITARHINEALSKFQSFPQHKQFLCAASRQAELRWERNVYSLMMQKGRSSSGATCSTE
jgi:hypothetical protein